MNFSPKAQIYKYFLTDVLTSYIGLALFMVIRFYILYDYHQPWDFRSYIISGKVMAESAVIPLGMLLIFWLSGFYNHPYERSRIQEFFTTLLSGIIIAFLIYFLLLTNDQVTEVSVNFELLLSLFLCVFIPVFTGRYCVTSIGFRHIRKHDWRFNTIIIGNSESARYQEREFRNTKTMYGYSVVAYIRLDGENDAPDSEIPVHSLDEIDEICKKYDVTQCIIVPEHYDEQRILQILPRLFSLNLPIKIAADTFSIITSGIRLTDIFADPFVDISAPNLSPSGQNIKRTLDVLISLSALVLCALPMAAIALWIKIDSKGSVFYRQKRLGLHKRPFYIYKFRSMYADAEKDTPLLTTDSDNRVTKAGRIMRKYRIDELPQFWNVLRGDMSIVGPRPEREYFAQKILEKAPYYTLIHQVRPGITSWGMVKYGYACNVEEMVKRAKFDIIYLNNMSLLIDTKIMIYTIKTVLTGRGQ